LDIGGLIEVNKTTKSILLSFLSNHSALEENISWQIQIDDKSLGSEQQFLMEWLPQVVPSSTVKLCAEDLTFSKCKEIFPILAENFSSLEGLSVTCSFEGVADETIMLAWAELLPQLVHLKYLKLKFDGTIAYESLTLLAEGIAKNRSLCVLKLAIFDNERRPVVNFLSVIEAGSTNLATIKLRPFEFRSQPWLEDTSYFLDTEEPDEHVFELNKQDEFNRLHRYAQRLLVNLKAKNQTKSARQIA